MTNISKKKLTDEQLEGLFKELSTLFSKKTAEQNNLILSDLLGQEERIMLAKRLAAIILLYKKQTVYFTAQTLSLSTSTVSQFELNLQNHEYSHITSLFEKPTPSIINLLNTIDSILHLGGILPHYGQTHRSERYQKENPNLSVNRKVRI